METNHHMVAENIAWNTWEQKIWLRLCIPVYGLKRDRHIQTTMKHVRWSKLWNGWTELCKTSSRFLQKVSSKISDRVLNTVLYLEEHARGCISYGLYNVFNSRIWLFLNFHFSSNKIPLQDVSRGRKHFHGSYSFFTIALILLFYCNSEVLQRSIVAFFITSSKEAFWQILFDKKVS